MKNKRLWTDYTRTLEQHQETKLESHSDRREYEDTGEMY